MSLRRWIGGQLWNVVAAQYFIEEAAVAGFDEAISMCGNNGQIAIIEGMEWDFHNAAEYAAAGGDVAEYLMDVCPYPDAVSEILETAGAWINAIIEMTMGQGIEGDYDEEVEAAEEAEEMF